MTQTNIRLSEMAVETERENDAWRANSKRVPTRPAGIGRSRSRPLHSVGRGAVRHGAQGEDACEQPARGGAREMPR
jgi:hypothetical protein